MKITDLDVFVLKTPLEKPFAFSQGWVRQRAATLVRVTTDAGTSGWGEAFCQGLEPPEIAAAAIEHALAPLVRGQDPLDSAVLWQRMYAATRDYGRKGSIVAAISAVDIALWDIAGRHYGQPIHRLLGGAFRTRVRPYATGFYRLRGQGEAERLADEARRHRASGFTAMKVKLGFGVEDDIAVMRAVARALEEAPGGGSAERVELMVDANHAYGRRDALRLGRALEALALRWFEEPLAPEDVDGYVELRSRLDVPLAAGENEHTPYGFAELFRRGAVDIAQPDVGSCGGITAARDIAALAQAHGVVVNPHVWGSAVAQAASLQLVAALPLTHPALHPREPIFEYDLSSHPFRQDLIESPWRLDEGFLVLPDAPGLGIDVRLDTVERYRTNRA